MKLVITHIENIAFNHQLVTMEGNAMTVRVDLKNGDDFLSQDQVGKEFSGFHKSSGIKEIKSAVRVGLGWFKIK